MNIHSAVHNFHAGYCIYMLHYWCLAVAIMSVDGCILAVARTESSSKIISLTIRPQCRRNIHKTWSRNFWLSELAIEERGTTRLAEQHYHKTPPEHVVLSITCFSGPDNILMWHLSQRTSRQEEITDYSSVLIFQSIFHSPLSLPSSLSPSHQHSVVDCWISPPLAIIVYELAEFFTQLLAWDQWSTLGTEQNIEPGRGDRHSLPQQSPPKQFW